MKEICNQAVSYLGIKDKIADEVVLADECGSVLAEIVEYFHYQVRLHDLLKAIAKWIDSLEVYDEALVGKENLNELHASVLRKAFAVHAENGRVLLLHHIHYRLGQLSHFPRSCDHVNVLSELLLSCSKLLILE